jgi:hypothetical protein
MAQHDPSQGSVLQPSPRPKFSHRLQDEFVLRTSHLANQIHYAGHVGLLYAATVSSLAYMLFRSDLTLRKVGYADGGLAVTEW